MPHLQVIDIGILTSKIDASWVLMKPGFWRASGNWKLWLFLAVWVCFTLSNIISSIISGKNILILGYYSCINFVISVIYDRLKKVIKVLETWLSWLCFILSYT
ncbi:hypothetical protein C8R48DRAFT_668610 [Suillus tomentosus]|nr:hypothetical protein C8R48DRAFT_668610 [Suillus tomentosus]